MQEVLLAGSTPTEVPLRAAGRAAVAAAWVPGIVVGIVWLAMFTADLAFIRTYGRNAPFQDDWELVPELTGQNPITVSWLFAQHNEHRIPLPRLLLLGLYRISGLDFRAGMYFNAAALAALALALIMAARAVRGRTRVFDAIFPLLLMNWGHWQNLLWSWQVQYVCSTVLAGIVLLVIVVDGNRLRFWPALAASLSVLALPLCGANGVALAPLLALWLGWRGIRSWRRATGRAAAVCMCVSAVVCLAATALYWVGYHAVAQPVRTDTEARLASALTFVGLGFGSAWARDWLNVLLRESILPMVGFVAVRLYLGRWLRASEIAVLVLGLVILRGLIYECQSLGLRPSIPSGRVLWGMVGLAATLACLAVLIKVVLRQPAERPRALGMVAYVVAFAGFALAIGYARAGAVGDPHYVARYLTLAITLPCWVALVMELYGPPAAKPLARPILLGLAVALAVGCIPQATREATFQAGELDAFIGYVHAGLPPSVIAQRQAALPFGVFTRSRQAYLAGCILLLRNAGHPEFQNVPDDPPAEQPSR